MAMTRANRQEMRLAKGDMASRSIPWHERPFLNLATAAELIGCSTAQVYALARAGRLTLVTLAGRTCVGTACVKALIDSAAPWAPTNRNKAAIAVTKARAALRMEGAR